MAKASDKASKRQFLRQHGTLNPRPQDVTHELFRHSDFFDPHDLVQVKYEMLRHSRVSKQQRALGYLAPRSIKSKRLFRNPDWPACSRNGVDRAGVTSLPTR